jgi:hypothetical protein
MKPILVPIHSFVDLITNSSSEAFIAATSETVTALKKVTANILSAAGSSVIPDDLFTFRLVYACDDPTGKEIFLTKKEITAKKAELEKRYEADETDDEIDEWNFPTEESEYYTCVVEVKATDETNKEAVKAAKSLSGLIGAYTLGERSC